MDVHPPAVEDAVNEGGEEEDSESVEMDKTHSRNNVIGSNIHILK